MLVSVIVPTHNRPEMLADALASVRAQTFTDYEIIVVSNGESADMRRQSLAVSTSYGARWFALNEGNLPAARNFGIAQAKGEWIGFLDDDDLWLPHKLARQVAEARHTSAEMIACDNIQFFPDGREVINRMRFPADWSWHKGICRSRWYCIPSCAFVRKNAIAAVGGFDARQRVFEDTELWRRIALSGGKLHQMDEPLTRYRRGHPSMMEISNSRKRQRYLFRFYYKAYMETPFALRFDLPSLQCFIWPIVMLCAPDWFHRPHPGLRPRTRILAARNWLASRVNRFAQMS